MQKKEKNYPIPLILLILTLKYSNQPIQTNPDGSKIEIKKRKKGENDERSNPEN
jgi:hypothetical protein